MSASIAGIDRAAPSVGLQYPADAAPGDVARFAAAAEALGYESVFVVEDCFLSGSIALAAVALAATGKLRVGIGLMPATLRNPALVAMELGTLAQMFPGRLSVAFGHGVEAWMAQIGARPPDRVVALEETVSAVRRLLAGGVVSMEGRHLALQEVALDHPPAVAPPVLIGTTGAKTLAAAARCADGILFPEGCGPTFVRAAGIGSPAFPSGRHTAVYAWLGIDDTVEAAVERLRPAVGEWLARGLFPDPVRVAQEALRDHGSVPSHALVREVAVCGDPAGCLSAVRDMAAAGADEILLAPKGADLEAQIERFAREVLPALARDHPVDGAK